MWKWDGKLEDQDLMSTLMQHPGAPMHVRVFSKPGRSYFKINGIVRHAQGLYNIAEQMCSMLNNQTVADYKAFARRINEQSSTKVHVEFINRD
jgi:hypothetical protein